MAWISNPKIAGCKPEWARFPGFSLLFDNPGQSYRDAGGMQHVACDVAGEPDLGLYKALHDGLHRLDDKSLTSKYGFCPLPPKSYHVTVFDGGNIGNLAKAKPEYQAALRQLLEALPDGWSEDHPLVHPAAVNSLTAKGKPEIAFRFGELKLWGGEVMVARLVAADADSAEALEQFKAERRTLSATYQEAFGFGAGPNYSPHVSLGYFATQAGGELADEKRLEWNELFEAITEGHVIRFQGVTCYGFTDMASFFRTRRS